MKLLIEGDSLHGQEVQKWNGSTVTKRLMAGEILYLLMSSSICIHLFTTHPHWVFGVVINSQDHLWVMGLSGLPHIPQILRYAYKTSWSLDSKRARVGPSIRAASTLITLQTWGRLRGINTTPLRFWSAIQWLRWQRRGINVVRVLSFTKSPLTTPWRSLTSIFFLNQLAKQVWQVHNTVGQETKVIAFEE